MTISGTSSYNLTAAEVVQQAYEEIGVIAVEQEIGSSEMKAGLTHLNRMLKAWSIKHLHIWMKKEAVLFLDTTTETYLLSNTGARTCYLDDFIPTATTSDVASGIAVIPVTSSAGMVIGDSVGIWINSTTRFWSTILTVDSPTQITLNDNLTAASSSGSSVFTYTSKVERPMRVLSVRRKAYGSNNEIPVEKWARSRYYDQVNKGSSGTVVAYYYSPQITDGQLSVWQLAGDVNQYLRLTYYEQLDDVTAGSQNLEFPQEWLDCLVYNLAVRLGVNFQVPGAILQTVAEIAASLMRDLEAWDVEQGNLRIVPNAGRYR